MARRLDLPPSLELSDGTTASSPEVLLNLLEAQPSRWREVWQRASEGELERWLRHHGWEPLADRVRDLRERDHGSAPAELMRLLQLEVRASSEEDQRAHSPVREPPPDPAVEVVGEEESERSVSRGAPMSAVGVDGRSAAPALSRLVTRYRDALSELARALKARAEGEAREVRDRETAEAAARSASREATTRLDAALGVSTEALGRARSTLEEAGLAARCSLSSDGPPETVELINFDLLRSGQEATRTRSELERLISSWQGWLSRRPVRRRRWIFCVSVASILLVTYWATQSEPESSFQVVPLSAATEMVAMTNSNVRSMPSVDSRRIGTLRKNERVIVTGRVQGRNWYAVSLAGRQGYVHADLVRPQSPPVQSTLGVAPSAQGPEDRVAETNVTGSRSQVATKESLPRSDIAKREIAPPGVVTRMYAQTDSNVRSIPSVSGERVGGLKRGQVVSVTGEAVGGTWYAVSLGGIGGYVHASLLGGEPPSAIPSPVGEVEGRVAAVLDTANLVVGSQVLRLHGIIGFEGHPRDEMAVYIEQHGGEVRCSRRGSDSYRCVTRLTGYDIAEAALRNGAARATPEAPPAYHAAQRTASRERVGIWGP